MLKTTRSYLHSSGHNTGTWRTDGRTDIIPLAIQRSALRAMPTRCKNYNCNAHCACAPIELLKRNFRNYSTVTVGSNFTRYEAAWLQRVRNTATEGKQIKNTHHWRCHWRMAAAMTTWSSLVAVAVSVRQDQWYVFCTLSFAVFGTCCNQLDSNLVNLEATVKMR